MLGLNLVLRACLQLVIEEIVRVSDCVTLTRLKPLGKKIPSQSPVMLPPPGAPFLFGRSGSTLVFLVISGSQLYGVTSIAGLCVNISA